MEKVKKMKIKKKTYPKAIKNWPEDERPREKLFRHGEHNLSNTELLAILLRTGSSGESAIDLARKIIQKFKTFQNMSHTDIRDWKEFKGLGQAKIAQIKTAVEIGRRLNRQEENQARIKIRSTEDIVKMFMARMCYLKNEVFKIVFCDPQNRIIDISEVAQGTPTGANPIIREIVSQSLQKFSSGVICVHNHPFGKALPSKEDEMFTKELRQAIELMDIKLLDHIIFGEKEFYSFDKGIARKYQEL